MRKGSARNGGRDFPAAVFFVRKERLEVGARYVLVPWQAR